VNKKLIWVALFGMAFGLIECAVVVYLRELYYPEGFAFPLKMISPSIALTEVLREAGTMVLLLSVALIAGRSAISRFAWFIYAFAFWDIFYYVFLYLILGWPPSLLTWDILFLIPVNWTGPVLAPVINSLTMILLAVVILKKESQFEGIRIKWLEWVMLLGGSLLTLFVYMEDTLHFLLGRMSFMEILNPANASTVSRFISAYIPSHFNWWLFTLSELLFLFTIGCLFRRYSKKFKA
jgi:hypothetical protein